MKVKTKLKAGDGGTILCAPGTGGFVPCTPPRKGGDPGSGGGPITIS